MGTGQGILPPIARTRSKLLSGFLFVGADFVRDRVVLVNRVDLAVGRRLMCLSSTLISLLFELLPWALTDSSPPLQYRGLGQ
jgi:hypothetical protein